jgi:multicomponent Na+:H+ antiporter subunit B
MIRHVILRALSKLLIPLIMIFALYVQFHGDYGPGGGFQAGVIFGAAIILYALMFGLDEARRVFPPRVLEFFVAFGLLLYGSVGVDAILMGGNFLDYDVLAHDPHHGQHLGILLVELGVGITVAAVMATIFFLFAGRGRSDA